METKLQIYKVARKDQPSNHHHHHHGLASWTKIKKREWFTLIEGMFMIDRDNVGQTSTFAAAAAKGLARVLYTSIILRYLSKMIQNYKPLYKLSESPARIQEWNLGFKKSCLTFTNRWHSSTTCCRVMFGICSMFDKILVRISASPGDLNPFTDIRPLNCASVMDEILNSS